MVSYIIAVSLISTVLNVVVSENVRDVLFRNGPCSKNEYLCLNDRCISKSNFCNGNNDCGDNSDEKYCYTNNACPTKHSYTACRHDNSYYHKCIPTTWKCDGVSDCQHAQDEQNCKFNFQSHVDLTSSEINLTKEKTRKWLLNQRNAGRVLHKWGTDLPRKAVALFLSDDTSFIRKENVSHELAYELSSSFLSKLALRKMEDVSTIDLASYLNAFLVTCIDPRNFYVVDLVAELRKRVDAINSTNPFALLALCNAQETITELDVQKLLDAFTKYQNKFRTDLQAMTVLALSCAATQPQKYIDLENLSELTAELKRKQSRNGTVENVKTTALIMQALFASQLEPDEDNFDERKAIYQVIRSQLSDGSFGNLINTYYALPIFNQLSLVNISSAHCPEVQRNEKETLQYLRNQIGDKWSIKYSLLIGDSKTLQRTMTLQIPKNTSFYDVMQYAADLDNHYKFEYNIRNRKPYIYSLSGLVDDPESEQFWIPYYVANETTMELKLINKSPADVIPENKDHLVFWYKKDA